MRKTPSRRRRGFTILETAVALGITSAILVALVLWVSSLMRSTTTAIEMVSMNRDADAATVRFASDTAAATSCAADGTAPVVVSYTATKFSFFADVVDVSGIAGADGFPDFVLWEFVDGSLRRGVVAGGPTCPAIPPIPSSYLVLAADVSPVGTDSFFEFYRSGVALTQEENCLPVTQFCVLDVVRLHATFTAPDAPGGAAATVDESFDLLRTTQRI